MIRLKYIPVFILALMHLTVKGQNLEDYLKMASENNPVIQARYADFKASLEGVARSKSLPDPNISFGYFIAPVETRVGPQIARFSLSQMFPWFGTLTARGEMSAYMAEARYQEFLNAQNELYYRVKAAWYPLYELNRKIELKNEDLKILKTYKELAETSFEYGKGSLVDVLRVDMMIDRMETEIGILEDQRQPLRVRFNKLLNRDDTASIAFGDTLTLTQVSDHYRLDSLYENNPALQSLDNELLAAEAEEEWAQRSGMPRFGIGVDYILIGKRTDAAPEGNGNDAIMPMVSVSVPIFRKNYRAAVQEARYRQEAVQYRKEARMNDLATAYEMAWYNMQRELKLIALYRELSDKTAHALNLQLSAYSNAGSDFEEVLRLNQELLEYQIAEITALVQYHTFLAEINYLTAK